MAISSRTRLDTGRIPKTGTMMLAGVLACSALLFQPALAQEALAQEALAQEALAQEAAATQETAEAADPTANLVLGDDLKTVFPEMTDALVVYLKKRRTRSVTITAVRGVEPDVAKVIQRSLASNLEANGIASRANASTRISGQLIDRRVGQRHVAVLEWRVIDRSGTEVCSMRKRLILTGPLVVDRREGQGEVALSSN